MMTKVAESFVGILVAGAVMIAGYWLLFGFSFPFDDYYTPPRITQHEGKVQKVVVTNPHNGGWSGTKSNPETVVLTVAGREYDLDGPLRQAATVKPGDIVVVECRRYDSLPEPSCEFGGVVATIPLTPEQKRR